MTKKQLHSLFKNPALAIVGLLSMKVFRSFPDELFLRIVYRCRTGKKLDLKNPTTFNEKLQWLKLYDRRQEYVTYVDKYAVRAHIDKEIGKEYLIPILGIWDSVDDIDFSALPEKYVLKCTHDSGGVVIVDSNTDIEKAKRKINKALRTNFYLRGREWPYKGVKPRIIAEKFMENDNDSSGLKDYKFLCFNGEPEMLMVCSSRNEMGVKVTFLDLDWNRLPFERHYEAEKGELNKPICFDEMVSISRKLSKGIPFVRVDLYEINGKVYFGELTLYPGCGFEEFRPDEWDYTLGEKIELSN